MLECDNHHKGKDIINEIIKTDEFLLNIKKINLNKYF